MTELKIGDNAPEFCLPDAEKGQVCLKDHRGKWVVLYFYPKDNTKGCTMEALEFTAAEDDFNARGAIVLGVSPDGEESHRKFISKHDLPFTLLVDQDHKLAELYGVWGEKSMYGKKYMGIIRSHFVINEKGILVDASYKVSPKKSVPDAMEAIR